MTASTRLSSAALLIAIVLTIVGIATVASADGTGDGTAIVVDAIDGDRQDQAVYVEPVGSAYRFKITAFTDDGDPRNVSRLAVGLGSLAALDDTDASSVEAPWRIDGFVRANATVVNDGDNTVTVELPRSATGYGRSFPAEGLAPFVALLEDAAGAPITADGGGRPWAVLSTDAALALEDGDPETADRKDRTPTPTRVSATHLPQTVERGEPLLNAGFGTVATSADEGRPSTPAAPAWTMTVDDPNANGVAGPASTTSQALLVEGEALEVDVAPEDVDGDRSLRIVQHLEASREQPDAWPDWTGASAIDARVRILDAPSATLELVARFATDTDSRTAVETVTITDDENWATLRLDVAEDCQTSGCSQLPLASVALSLTDTPDAAALRLQIDETAVSEARAGPVTLPGDAQDGHVVDVDPTGGQPTVPASRAVSVDLTQTAAGPRYLLDVGVRNLTRDDSLSSATLAGGQLQVGRLDPRAAVAPDRWADTYDDPASDGTAATTVVDGDRTTFTVGAQALEGERLNVVVRAFDSGTGEVQWTTTWDGPVGGVDIPYDAVVSPDGSTLYLGGVVEKTGSGTDYLALALDTTNGEVLWTATYNNPDVSGVDFATQIAVDDDGDTLVLSGLAEIEGSVPSMDSWIGVTVAFDTATRQQLWTHRHNGSAAYLATAPAADRVYLLTDGDDPAEDAHLDGSDLRVMALQERSGSQAWTTYVDPDDVPDYPAGIAASPDGDQVYVAGLSDHRRWAQLDYLVAGLDADSGALDWHNKGYRAGWREGMHFAMSPDGDSIAVTLQTPPSVTHADWDTIAFATDDGDMRWERFFQGPRGPLGYTERFGNYSSNAYPDYGRPTALTFGPDGERLHVTGYGYENGNVPSSRTYTVTYDAASGDEVWLDAVDQSPVGRDEPTAATVDPQTGNLLVVGYTDVSVGTAGGLFIGATPDRVYLDDADMVTLAYPSDSSGVDRFAASVGVYEHADGGGAVAVVDAEDLLPGATANAWYGVNASGTPVAGYHSLAKDPLRGTAIADGLDLAATPLTFTEETSGQEAHAFEITDVRESGNGTLVDVRGQAPYREAARIQIAVGDARSMNASAPVGDGNTTTVRFPGLSLPETDVRIEVLDGEFHAGDLVELGAPAVGPITIDAPVELANLTDGHTVELAASLADRDLSPCVEQARWTVTDGTQTETLTVTDVDGDGCLSAEEARRSYTFPDDGDWTITLEATDDEGHTATATRTVTGIANAQPSFQEPRLDVSGEGLVSADPLQTAWTVRAGLELTLESQALDPSRGDQAAGTLRVQADDVLQPQADGGYARGSLDENLTLADGRATFTPPGPGVYNLTVTWTDPDGATISTTGVLDAVDPLVTVQTADHHAEVDGTTAGDDPLAGETLNASVTLLFAGDRPDDGASLQLLDPAGTLLANDTQPAVTTLTDDGVKASYTFSLEHPLATTGDYTLNLTGTTLAGLDLATVHEETVDVRQDTAPQVALSASLPSADDGKVYMEATETLAIAADVSDPDCVDDGPRCALGLDWTSGPRATQEAPDRLLVEEPEPHVDASGSTVSLTVTDHLGQTADSDLTYVVDDHLLTANLSVAEATATVTDERGRTIHVVPDPARSATGFTIEADVSSDQGAALAGQALWDARYRLHPLAAGNGLGSDGSDAPQPFANGDLQVHVEPGPIDTGSPPGLYTVDLTVLTSPGRIDRPDRGPAEESSTLRAHVWLGPYVTPDGEVIA